MTSTTPEGRLDLNASDGVKVFVAGYSGLVGSAIWRRLARAGFTNLVGRSSQVAT